jgi:hypothetical protein
MILVKSQQPIETATKTANGIKYKIAPKVCEKYVENVERTSPIKSPPINE